MVTSVFFFRTQVRGQHVHALADTGASENFISAPLAAQLGLSAHTRRQKLMIKIADGSIQECTQFVRATIRIGEWTDRMSFVILPTGVPLVLGMPFFLKHEPRILWRARKFLLLLRADVLPRAYRPPPPYSHNQRSCR